MSKPQTILMAALVLACAGAATIALTPPTSQGPQPKPDNLMIAGQTDWKPVSVAVGQQADFGGQALNPADAQTTDAPAPVPSTEPLPPAPAPPTLEAGKVGQLAPRPIMPGDRATLEQLRRMVQKLQAERATAHTCGPECDHPSPPPAMSGLPKSVTLKPGPRAFIVSNNKAAQRWANKELPKLRAVGWTFGAMQHICALTTQEANGIGVNPSSTRPTFIIADGKTVVARHYGYMTATEFTNWRNSNGVRKVASRPEPGEAIQMAPVQSWPVISHQYAPATGCGPCGTVYGGGTVYYGR